MKRWKYLLIVLPLIVGGLLAYVLLRERTEPAKDAAVDLPVKAKWKPLVRKSVAESERIRKTKKKIDVGDEVLGGISSRCVKTTSFDETTGVLCQEIDDNCDGNVDRCRVQELNEYGEEIRGNIFADCGENPTYCYQIERNEWGEVIASTFDNDCDGHPEECRFAKLNELGDIIDSIVDIKCDGKLNGKGDQHNCFSFSYDEEGMVINENVGRCEEKPKLSADYEYDIAAGIRRERWHDTAGRKKDYCITKIYHGAPWGGADIEDPGEDGSFLDKECDGVWESCSISDAEGKTVRSYSGHGACAEKYEELVRRNRAGR